MLSNVSDDLYFIQDISEQLKKVDAGKSIFIPIIDGYPPYDKYADRRFRVNTIITLGFSHVLWLRSHEGLRLIKFAPWMEVNYYFHYRVNQMKPLLWVDIRKVSSIQEAIPRSRAVRFGDMASYIPEVRAQTLERSRIYRENQKRKRKNARHDS